jgi:iron complex outermembrane recepter protein
MASQEGPYTGMLMSKSAMLKTAALLFALTVSISANALADSPRPVNVPAGDLTVGLELLEKQSGVEIVYQPDLLKGLKTGGVKGTLSSEEAVTKLLKGTKLKLHTDRTGVLLITEGGADGAAVSASGEKEPAAKRQDESSSGERLPLAQTNQGQDQTPAGPQVEQGKEEQPKKKEGLEEIVVTGSRLSRRPGEAAQDVRIYTRDQIDRSGQTTVSAFVNSLPSVSVGVPESFANYFGGTTVNLRGLPIGSTLILIDGHRVETSGTQINNNFFDLSNIPVSAVDRIEVLASGASAIYGSDAVAGVVNVILKKDFQGFEVSSKYGWANSNDESDSSIAWGKAWDRGHVSLIGSYQYRSELSGADRKLTASNDYTPYGGPNKNFPICNAASVFSTTGSNLPGLNSPHAAVPAGFKGTPSLAEFSGTADTLNSCSIQSEHGSLIPETHRIGALLTGDYTLTPNTSLFVEVLYAHNSQLIHEGPQYLFALPTFQSFSVSAANPYNPFGESVGIGYQFQGYDSDFHFDTNYFRPVVGMRGAIGDKWKWEVSALYSRDATTFTSKNYSENNALIQAALNSFFNPATYDYVGSRTALSATVTGPVFTLPAGDVEIALGSEVSRDELSTNEDLTFTTNNPVSSSYSRRTGAVFGETRIPILARSGEYVGTQSNSVLAATLAVRYDHYSDFGSTTNPQYGIEWQPFQSLLVRATYADSFEAPSLYSLYGPDGLTDVLVTDPKSGLQVLVPTKTGGNSALRPQIGHSETLGFVYSPIQIPRLRLAVTNWRILEKSTVQTLPAQVVVDLFPDRAVRDPTTSQITSIDSTLANAGTIDVAGIDYALSFSWPTSLGTWATAIESTQTYRYLTQPIPGGPVSEFVAKASDIPGEWAPRWKYHATLSWNRSRYSAQAGARYVNAYQDYDTTRTIGNFWLFDATINVALGKARTTDERSPSGAQLSVGAVNLFNRAPQYSSFTRNFVGYDPSQADIRGRFLYLELRYRFD